MNEKPGDKKGQLLWFEPSWQFRGPDQVRTGSRQAQEDASAPDPRATFYAAVKELKPLDGLTVEAVQIEAITRSLILRLAGGFELRTFVSDPTQDLDWHIDDFELDLSLEGWSKNLELVERED